ncbi:MAG TPA: PAS domain S-box protein [Pseudolabrys sp.]|nr:PAS domain S-box protein [Pseudolabrys sp.]
MSVEYGSRRSDDARYRLLLDAITDYAICMLDAKGIVSSWNSGAERCKGYAAEEIIGQHFSRFYTDEDRALNLPQRALATAAEEGRFESEGWRVRKDGMRFWANVIIDPIRDPSGTLIGFAKVTRDLSERKAGQENLRKSEEQFQLLVQGVTDYAIFMLDPGGHVISWNAGAQKIKGYRSEDIIGEHYSRFYTPEDRGNGEPKRNLEIAAREGRVEKEGIRLRKDGTRFWAHVIIDAIRDAGGDLIGFAKVTRDIGERKQAERELDRARELLVQSQKMDAIGQLTGGIAHDFNNLLTAVLGSLELLRKRVPADPKITALLNNAIQGAERGATLTHRMLSFARRQEIQLEAVDVRRIVGDMQMLLQQSVGPLVMVDRRFPMTLLSARTDPNQLEMALLNLAVNARDAMPKGGRITISAHEAEIAPGPAAALKPGRYVVLSMADNGEGMDPDTVARATEPFFTTKGIGKGTGLGLSMVHGLTTQSGGTLVVKSRKGEGTTIELWFPAVDEEPAQRGDESAGRMLSVADRPYVILAVDDDSLVLMNTAAMLEELGHKVFEAYSGREALDILRRESKVDLVITDQAMPQMTGIELAEAIRNEWPEMPVVLATGYADLPDGIASMLPRLNKPFHEQDLAEVIVEAMQTPPAGGRVLKFSRPDR